MLAASAAGRCSAGWLWVQPTAWCPLPTAHCPPFWVTSKVPCPRTPGHTPPPAPSYFESMESHVIRMSADSCLGGGVVRLDCGKGHPIFKKCSPCDPAQPQNRHTESQTHSLCGVVLFDADAQLEKVVASTPCSVACMAHMLHHCRGRVLGSPRFAAPPHNCQGSQAIFGQLPVTFPCLSPQPPPPQRVTACS